jgi:hypothetical protein
LAIGISAGKNDRTTTRTNLLKTTSIGLKKKKTEKKRNMTALVVNPTSSGGSTGKDWDMQFTKIKETFGENPEIVFY